MKLSKISKSFKGNTDSSKQIVLDDFDLTIKPAEFISVTGPSGSGKSTLINSTLYPIAATKLNGASTLNPSPYKEIIGINFIV